MPLATLSPNCPTSIAARCAPADPHDAQTDADRCRYRLCRLRAASWSRVDEAEREAAGEFTQPKGELVVTAPIMFGRLHVLPVVAEFLAEYPEINIRLHLGDRNVDLIDDHVDMAVRFGALPDSSMVATPIGDMRTVTCASPAVLERHGMPDRPDALLDYPIVAVEIPLPTPAWRYRVPVPTRRWRYRSSHASP